MAKKKVLAELIAEAPDPKLDPEHPSNPRDPEDRNCDVAKAEVKEKMMDKTLADSFPTSDPPSSIPDPEEDPFAA